MNKHKWIGAAGVAIAALSVPVTYSIAQGPGPGQGPGQGQPPRGQFQAPMQMGGPGGATMVADSDFLYILQGNRLFKVDKRELGVRVTGSLPMPQRDGQRPAGSPPPTDDE